MLHARVGKEVTSLLCDLMPLADYLIAYALLAQPKAILVVDFSSFFGAQVLHAFLVFLVLSLAALRIERCDCALIHTLLVLRRVTNNFARAPKSIMLV